MAAVLAGAGCGSGDDGESEESYRERAVALCKDAEDVIEEIPPPSAPGDIAGYLRRIIDASAEFSDDYEELEPPDELRADHEASERVGRRVQARLEALLESVSESDRPAVTAARELQQLVRSPDFRRSERLLRRLGLEEECSSVAAPADPSPA